MVESVTEHFYASMGINRLRGYLTTFGEGVALWPISCFDFDTHCISADTGAHCKNIQKHWESLGYILPCRRRQSDGRGLPA